MTKKNITITILIVLAAGLIALLPACSGQPAIGPDPQPPAADPPVPVDLPEITAVNANPAEMPRYGSTEMIVTLDADYSNPYDLREVSFDALIAAPDGAEMRIPGFWDGKDAWKIRFTPSQVGEWRYAITLTDQPGTSRPAEGILTAVPSELHGWLQPGRAVNQAFSGRYLVHRDGTPFYRLGHCDALNILIDGFDIDRGVGLFDNMVEAGENYVVWWPLYNTSPLKSSYSNYSPADMAVIDLVVQDAQKRGVFLIFTIWDHPELRDDNHPWEAGRWSSNGFSKLTDIDSFFTSDEAWAWQENFYRYTIARWGYSPAIGMWQTVSEINGTNSFDQTDPWHGRVNAYFIEHDPYRHPTTASQSGAVDWTAGHDAMDVPQVHLYDFNNDAVGAAEVVARWTGSIWAGNEKPNWVGEFGVTGNTYYPELFHNAIWAALGAGAALTPAEWNSGGAWLRMSEAMLAALDPAALKISSSDPQVRGWGVAGDSGGLFGVQDFALEGATIEEVRANQTIRQGLELTIDELAGGAFTIRPYDTWQGAYLDSFEIDCPAGAGCPISLPDFKGDIAFKIVRK